MEILVYFKGDFHHRLTSSRENELDSMWGCEWTLITSNKPKWNIYLVSLYLSSFTVGASFCPKQLQSVDSMVEELVQMGILMMDYVK